MMKRIFTAAACVAVLTTAAQAERVISVSQDGDFQPYNLRWNGAFAKGYDAQVALKNIGGKLAMCGVGVVTNIQLSSAVKSALRGGTVKVNGKTVIKDFSFFAKANSAGALKAAKANCKVTDVAVPKRTDKLDVRYGRAVFRN
ncbi:MAG: hypothetical protein AAGA08_05370 [Pseudomonadota bacterium]